MKRRLDDNQCVQIAEYYLEHYSTLADVAEEFGVTKSIVFREFTNKLPKIDEILAIKVRALMNQNKAERGKRGAFVTNRKRWHSKY